MTKASKKPNANRPQGGGKQLAQPFLDDSGCIVVTTLQQISREFARSESMIVQWRDAGMPGTRGNWRLRDIIPWVFKNKFLNDPNIAKEIRDKYGDSESDDELKREKLRQQIRDNELNYAERIGQLIPKILLDGFMEKQSSRLRTAGELIRKHHGDDAQREAQ